jgi:hypothetical protein
MARGGRRSAVAFAGHVLLVALLLLAAPAAVDAAQSALSIIDAGSGVPAHVPNDGNLQTQLCDDNTCVCGRASRSPGRGP